jgi:hypothetical protein
MFEGVEVGVLQWRKSARSETPDTCVEVSDLPFGGRAVRDSKLGDGSPVLAFTAPEWAAFAAGVRDGEFG